MGLNIVIGPSSEFHDWTETQWDEFWDTDNLEVYKLGNWSAIAETIETININLENDNAGSKFPLLNQITINDFCGWYHSALPALIVEISTIKNAFLNLPINHQLRMEINYQNNTVSFKYYENEYLDNLISEFKRLYPDKPLDNLYILNHYFLDTLEHCAKKALELNNGLIYC